MLPKKPSDIIASTTGEWINIYRLMCRQSRSELRQFLLKLVNQSPVMLENAVYQGRSVVDILEQLDIEDRNAEKARTPNLR